MAEGALTPALQRFIAQHIESLEKLEILLLLQGNPDTVRSSEEVYRSIQSSLPSVTRKLQELCVSGMVHCLTTGEFQYKPRNAYISEQVSALQTAYRERRIKVIESIFSPKSDELQAFSDAFRLRKESE